MHAYLMTIPALEAALYKLYAAADLDDAGLKHRALLAWAYYDKTGAFFAARYIY